MNPEVSFEIGSLKESLATHVTHVLLLTKVDLRVGLKGARP